MAWARPGARTATAPKRSAASWSGYRTSRHAAWVTAEVHESNLASRRLLERLNFTIDHLSSPYVWYTRPVRPAQ